jgi:lipoate-protein ligase A
VVPAGLAPGGGRLGARRRARRPAMSDWIVERHRGAAARLHEASADTVEPGPEGGVRRRIRVLEATAPALVLGRAEPEEHVDPVRAAAAGVGVVRRRSGGGAVLVEPDGIVWLDVVVPASDPLWSADVGRAMWWIGEAWATALEAVGLRDARVWRGPMLRTEWSDRVCFAGVGPGEVVLGDPGGRPTKVVGVAQRRTRQGALFQCAALVEWDPAAILDLLALPVSRRRTGAEHLAGSAVGVGACAGALVEAVIAGVAAVDAARPDPQLP